LSVKKWLKLKLGKPEVRRIVKKTLQPKINKEIEESDEESVKKATNQTTDSLILPNYKKIL